jgi:hypothetical protein
MRPEAKKLNSISMELKVTLISSIAAAISFENLKQQSVSLPKQREEFAIISSKSLSARFHQNSTVHHSGSYNIEVL